LRPPSLEIQNQSSINKHTETILLVQHSIMHFLNAPAMNVFAPLHPADKKYNKSTISNLNSLNNFSYYCIQLLFFQRIIQNSLISSKDIFSSVYLIRKYLMIIYFSCEKYIQIVYFIFCLFEHQAITITPSSKEIA
jgi:hypothetical protein